MKLFVVILHYGKIEVTKKCLESLRKNEPFPKTIIVVNNTEEKIKSKLPRHTIVIDNNKNLGFAKGVNIGIAEALSQKADYILLLNNDAVIRKHFIEKLLSGFGKSVGIVGPAIQFHKSGKTLFDIGGMINTLFFRTSHEEVERITDVSSKIVDYVSGCCMLVKKEVFKKAGFFDGSFFLYYEDADFCLRARKAGFTTMVIPSAVISHALSASKGKTSPFTIYHLLRSGILFGRKYAESLQQKIANKIFILAQTILFLRANPNAATVIVKALLS